MFYRLSVVVAFFSADIFSQPLCEIPSANSDVFINCKIDSGQPNASVDSYYDDSESLIVLEYNIDRNGAGGDGSNEIGLEGITNLLSSSNVPAKWDVLILSEVSRGCDRYSNSDNGALAIASSFGFHWAYAVEYVSYNDASSSGECSFGNAIVSRFPLDDLEQFRFETQCCRYGGRWGSRTSLKGSLKSRSGLRSIDIVSTHLESGMDDVKSVLNATYVRERQAAELSKQFLANRPDTLTLVGGDMNSPLREVDPTRLAFEHNKFHDVLDVLPWGKRNSKSINNFYFTFALFVALNPTLSSSCLVTPPSCSLSGWWH